MRHRFHVTLALAAACALTLTACSQPPREPGSDPAADLPAPPADDTDGNGTKVYDLESEGEFPPPPRDVEFEEDQLPPPETLPSTPIGAAADTVAGQDVEPRKVEPSVEVPVEPTAEAERRSGPWRPRAAGVCNWPRPVPGATPTASRVRPRPVSACRATWTSKHHCSRSGRATSWTVPKPFVCATAPGRTATTEPGS